MKRLIFAVKFIALTGGYFFTRAPSPNNKYRRREKSVEDVAVLFLLENLKRILLYHVNIIRDSRNQVEMLENDVRLFKAFLVDLSRRRYENKPLKQLESQIRDLVCEAEQAIGSFVTEMGEIMYRNFFERYVTGPIKLITLAKEVKSIRGKVKGTYVTSTIVLSNLKARSLSEKEKTMVCEETEQETLVDCFVEESNVSEVTSMTKAAYPSLARQHRQEKSFEIQELEENLPLAIGYVFYDSPVRKISMVAF